MRARKVEKGLVDKVVTNGIGVDLMGFQSGKNLGKNFFGVAIKKADPEPVCFIVIDDAIGRSFKR